MDSSSNNNILSPVNFSGIWVLDPESSDSLAPLMKYHGKCDIYIDYIVYY